MQVIEQAAQPCMTLEPGDMIAMVPTAGVGQARKPPVWMKQGPVVRV